MSIVGEVSAKEDRPAYVRFERVAVEDKRESINAGHFVARDVDYALVTPPYSKDVFKQEVNQWFRDLKQQIDSGRIPENWLDKYKDAYTKWQNGQQIPLDGTPIKGWGVISPAQQETLIRLSILTVEDLANVNDEGLKYIGMGAIELKTKAKTWIAQLNDRGPLTQKMASLESENALLRANIDTLTKKLNDLVSTIEMEKRGQDQGQGHGINMSLNSPIDAADILENAGPPRATHEPEQKKKRGRPKKIMVSEEI